MKTKRPISLTFLTLTFLCSFLLGCEKTFEDQATLDSLLNGSMNLGSTEVNDAMIRKLQYQKIKKSGKTNGVVIPKDMLTTAVNGFSIAGINYPLDSSNFDKWDFLVVYPGIKLEGGVEVMDPAIFFYKGSNISGQFIPEGQPVTDISFPGGGGGPGGGGFSTPPPR